MDTAYMKERNYRQVMSLRHQNQREERILENKLYSKRGVESIHKYHLSQIEHSEHSIKQELMKLRNTSTTTWGFLPPRPGKPGEKHVPLSDPFEKLFAAEKIMKKKKMMSHNSPTGSLQDLTKSPDHRGDGLYSQSPIKTAQSSPGKLEDIAHMDMGKARKNVFSRLAQPKKYKDPSQTIKSVVSGKPPSGRVISNNKETTIKLSDEKSGRNSKGTLTVEISLKDNATTNESKPADLPSINEEPKKSSLSKTNKKTTNAIIMHSDQSTIQTSDASTAKQVSVNFAPHVQTQDNQNDSDKDFANKTEDTNNMQNKTNQSQTVKKTTDTSYNADNQKRPGALTPIKETGSDIEGSKIKRLNKQNSFARSITRGSSFYSSSKGSVTKKKVAALKKEISEVDEKSKYNPDGSLRTLYSLPDFQKSIDDALNARYLRMKVPVWYEREMSVSEVWKDKDKPLKRKLKLN